MSEKIMDFPETITDNTEKIGSESEKIEINSEKIAEFIPEKIREKGQRGPDKVQRRINPNSLRNLKQYQHTFPQNTENSRNWIWILIGIIITIVGILIWLIYQSRKEKRQSKKIQELDE